MTQENNETRREFLQKLATATGAVVLLPVVSACSSGPEPKDDKPPTESESKPAEGGEEAKAEEKKDVIPRAKPAKWDPITWNKERGLAGAIPESYHEDIKSANGDKNHLGKHLPFIPTVENATIPAGFLAIMWGDPAKGHAKHPNAKKSEKNPEGHWYNWIRVRKARAGEAEELQSDYAEWPGNKGFMKDHYVVQGGGSIVDEDGKNTIYLAAIPKDCQSGDMVRIHAHCLTHGEYVDFLTIP